MKTQKITEKMLLDGVNSIANGGTYTSQVNGTDVHWSYRTTDAHGTPETVCEVDNREVITLEYDRTGIIEIDHANDDHAGLDKLKNLEQKLWGNMV